jgi:hypothetical protein
VARCEVTRDINLQTVVAGAEVHGEGDHTVEVPFELDEVTFGIQLRVISTGAADMSARLEVDLDEHPTEAAGHDHR